MTIEDGEPGGRFGRFDLTTRGSFANAGDRITQFGKGVGRGLVVGLKFAVLTLSGG